MFDDPEKNFSYLYAFNPDGSLKWKFKIDSVDSSPVISSDGTIYLIVGDRKRFRYTSLSSIYALNPDGTLKWKYKTDELISFPPVISPDGTIYVGGKSFFYAFNPDGSLKYDFTNTILGGTPKMVDSKGIIYVVRDDGIYALNPDGTLKWHYKSDNVSRFAPAISSDGTIYITTGSYSNWNDNKQFYAIDKNGALKWKQNLRHNTSSVSPSIIDSNGTIYVGINEEHSFIDSYWSEGTIFSFNPDGSLKWKFRIKKGRGASGSKINSFIIAPSGIIYLSSSSGYLYAIGEKRR